MQRVEPGPAIADVDDDEPGFGVSMPCPICLRPRDTRPICTTLPRLRTTARLTLGRRVPHDGRGVGSLWLPGIRLDGAGGLLPPIKGRSLPAIWPICPA